MPREVADTDFMPRLSLYLAVVGRLFCMRKLLRLFQSEPAVHYYCQKLDSFRMAQCHLETVGWRGNCNESPQDVKIG